MGDGGEIGLQSAAHFFLLLLGNFFPLFLPDLFARLFFLPAIFVGFMASGAQVVIGMLNGYSVMLVCIAVFALAGAFLMAFYKPRGN